MSKVEGILRFGCVILLLAVLVQGQTTGHLRTSNGVPSGYCNDVELVQDYTTGVVYSCSGNSWVSTGSGSWGAAAPSGSMLLMLSGACPAGYTENDALAGKMLVAGTTGAGDQGTTGGSNTATPTGSNATVAFTPAGTNASGAFSEGAIAYPANVPAFTGAALATTTFAIPTGSGSFKGTSTGGFSTVGGAAPGSTGATTSKSPGTPAGTIAWPANPPTIGAGSFTQPTFTGSSGTVPSEAWTGNSMSVQNAYVKVFFCVHS